MSIEDMDNENTRKQDNVTENQESCKNNLGITLSIYSLYYNYALFKTKYY